MSDFEAEVQKCRKLKTAMTTAEDTLRRRRAKFDAAWKELRGRFGPGLRTAAERYNAGTPYLGMTIVPEQLGVTLNSEAKIFGLELKLKFPSGVEPDEEFDGSEPAKIGELLGPLVLEELRAIGIPYGFSGVTVPSSYYMK